MLGKFSLRALLRRKPAASLADDDDDTPDEGAAEAALPIRTNETVVRSLSFVVIALTGVICIQFFRANSAEDNVRIEVVFVQIPEGAEKTYRIMERSEIRTDYQNGMAESLATQYVQRYYEVLRDEAEMTARWAPGGWMSGYLPPDQFETASKNALASKAVAQRTEVDRKIRNIRCSHVGAQAIGCRFIEGNYDKYGTEQITRNWSVTITYTWLEKISPNTRKMNPTGWQPLTTTGGPLSN